MKYESLYERLLANSRVVEGQSEANGCWEWTGNVDDDGYGRLTMRICGKHSKVRAIRAMEEVFRGDNEFDLDNDPLGPIFAVAKPKLTEDETIDHVCWFTGCVNPDHWGDPVSRAENTSRMHQRRKR